MEWIIPANSSKYHHAEAFQKWGFIDWRVRESLHQGDTVYIYCTRPLMRVMFKAVVVNANVPVSDIVNDVDFWVNREDYEKKQGQKHVRLKLVQQAYSDMLTLKKLAEHGLSAAPQHASRINASLASYIDKYLDEYCENSTFPDSGFPDGFYEGAVCQVQVNKYERSSIARQKCIERYGAKCSVCGMDFEKKYGDIGKGFIHVHHLVPLNEIGEEYIVNYETDLIPVCPNCHAMLHRNIDGKSYTWEELRKIVCAE